MTKAPALESIKSEIIANLDESYDLTYVDYRDTLTPGQVAAIARNDTEALHDSTWEWASESAAIGARSAALEAVSDYESKHPVPEDFDTSEMAFEIEEVIRDRDTSNPIKELASNTSDALLRVQVIAEDDGFSDWDDLAPSAYLKHMGLPLTDKNVETMDQLIADTPSEVHMAYVVFRATVADLLATMDSDTTVTVENPEIILGNPFTGGYWNATFEGTLSVSRSRMLTDEDAFGYSVEETYGGFVTDSTATFTFEAEEGDETA